jgi:glycosyltransferase involved in cell wall biosynthesis
MLDDVISVVLPVRDGLPWLEEQLQALGDQQCDEPWEVVVADNGSVDATVEVVEGWAEHSGFAVRVVDASATKGPAAARNRGAAAAAGELLAFCDADDVVQPGWLSACVLGLASADLVAGVFDPSSLNDRPPSGTEPAAFEQLGFLPAGLASNLAVRRGVFEEAGGFSEDLTVGEDIDLCWRLQLSGCRFATVTNAVVAKREPRRLGAIFTRAFSYGRSGPLLYRRFRGQGARRHVAGGLKAVAWMVVAVPLLVRAEVRRQWVRAAGVRLGRMVGSVEQRVFFP